MKLITIDCGTSFIKAALMEDRTGNILKRISKSTDIIEKFVQCCNNKDYQTAFDLLSDDCKKEYGNDTKSCSKGL